MHLEKTKAQMKKGVLEIVILSIIARGESYASDIIKELREANLLVVEGTLYPLLTRLKNEGMLEYRWEESKSGPPRKYYAITTLGKNISTQLNQDWQELVSSIDQLINKK
jgi:PadR family transcriptional regulator PadR